MKICLLGAQGVGKSTLVSAFKDKYYTIDNIARSVAQQGGTINRNGTLSSQRKIFRNYLQALNTDKDYISTRSTIDVVAYTIFLYIKESNKFKKFLLWLEYCRELIITKLWLIRNKDIVIVYIPIEFEIKDDSIRDTDKNYQKTIDLIMYNLFQELFIPNKWTVRGSIDDRVRMLNNIIHITKEN